MNSTPDHTLRWRVLAGLGLGIVAIIVVLHLYLSTWLLDYVNDVLNHIDGFQGSVESIDINLYRGAYRINKLVLNKKDGAIPTPFIKIAAADLSLQWGALMHGRVVASATLIDPEVHFAVNKAASQNGGDTDWTKPIKALMPIDINYVEFKNGDVSYQDFASTPKVNVFIHHLDGEIRNLRNVQSADDPLPSTVVVTGSSIGNGTLSLKGNLNILKSTPDMNLLLSLENVHLPALNNYSEAYAAFDFKDGNFSVYTQLNVKDGAIAGYVKPIATNLTVDVLKSDNPVKVAWDTTVAAVLKVFTNINHDQFATKVDLTGRLGAIGTDPWSALGGIIRNAFISAMSKGFDETGDHNVIKKPAP